MVEADPPAALPRRARRAATASIRSFFTSESSPQNAQILEIADEKPGAGADDPDFDAPAAGKHKKRKQKESPRKPDRETRKARASKKLIENHQKFKDGDEVEARLDGEATDLRREARAAAEEYAVLSVGKPVHPFFLRKNVEQQPATHEAAVNPESLLIPSRPFHVLQSSQPQDFTEPSWNASVFKFALQEQSSFKLGDGDSFCLLSTEKKFADRREDFEPVKIFSENHRGSKPEEKTDNNDLWTDYHQPKSSQEVCGNREAVALLNDWLCSWKQRALTKKLDFFPSKLRVEDDDFQGDGCDEDDEEDDGLETTLLLTGPVGCGKSAAVYACANEQGFNVIEINASDNRSGAAIKHTVGEASESQALNWCSLDLESCGKADKKMTMILFEEVDTVFEEDKGFVAALVKLAKTAKRPIIMTSNFPHPLVPCSRRIIFSKPAVKDLVAQAFLVCSSRGVFPGSPELMKRIVESHGQDLRKLLMALQFWSQGSSSSSSPASKLLASTSTSSPFDLLPRLVNPVSFPCFFSQKLAGRITSAAEEAERFIAGALVERVVSRALEEAQAQRAARKMKISQRRASSGAEKSKPQAGKRRRLKKLRDVEVGNGSSPGLTKFEAMNSGSGEVSSPARAGALEPVVRFELMNTCSGEVSQVKACGTPAGALGLGVNSEDRTGEEVTEVMNTGSGETFGVKLCGTQAGALELGVTCEDRAGEEFGSGEVSQVKTCGAREPGVTFDRAGETAGGSTAASDSEAMNTGPGEVSRVEACGTLEPGVARSPELMNTSSGEVFQVQTCEAREPGLASEDRAGETTGVSTDPVGAQWLELRSSGKNLCGEFECSPETSGMNVVEALANASDWFSSSDLISCVDISSHLAQQSLHHLLDACSGFINEVVEQPSFYNTPWSEQQPDRIPRQKILEEEIFLAHPKVSRQCFTVPGFCDYISLMARIVKLEEIQKAENLRPKNKRSRGYQEDYLAARNVTRQGIEALRELFVFDDT